MKLLIISHTEHYKDINGNIVGWGPTIREINFLAQYFDKIYHCAPLHNDVNTPPSSMSYIANNIEYIPLIPSGGKGIREKVNILLKAPKNLRIIKSILAKSDVFQFRAPTGMGVYILPWLLLFSKKKGWFKYAGNWAQLNPPIGYAFQRWLLKTQTKFKVTINGAWDNQPSHCITFENPCLSSQELVEGINTIEAKNYNGKLDFCFVGRLESAKGVGRILGALSMLKDTNRIGTVHLVGDGEERTQFEAKAKKLDIDIRFYGFIDRDKVAEVMKKSHVFLLPSTASEGFPKVIAEASNYGCVPIVSDVSSIGQYIKDGHNGFLVDHKTVTVTDLHNVFIKILDIQSLKHCVTNSRNMISLFSFENYYQNIRKYTL